MESAAQVSSNPKIQALVIILGFITTVLTIIYREPIQNRMRRRQAPNRLEMIFDGYEGLIKELQGDLKRVRQDLEVAQEELNQADKKADELKYELKQARKENRRLVDQIRRIKQ